ncbi:PC-Esterase domain-containing protein [Cephalotus follicularis]|uniref:PC-Esterase domain-containing protein n=1 Tax=Cephalotus follicularis TaxID=3775 RepID=A0A1Q3B1D2_CEPFO|nr:PC-Esterase domain-containing protein [Cephalotus follicularis]
MFGAVQVGLLAACIVLFVPMGMAGWHLSRNKMLFFSGALFITLAVFVHLTPYFPSISDFVSSVQSVVVFDSRDTCINFVNDIVWEVTVNNNTSDVDVLLTPNHSSSFDLYDKNWDWAQSRKVVACEFQKLGQSDASDLLNGSWVVVAGDSQARLFVLSLLSLVLGFTRMDSIRGDLFKRHSDYNVVLSEIGMRLDFIWAPYENNLTDLMFEFNRKRNCPDVLVMGTGLWHLLHVTNASDYGESLKLLSNSVVSLLPFSPELGADGPVRGSVSIRRPHLFWLGMPVLINGMLNSEEKREKMSDKMWHAYDSALCNSKLLRQFGGPLLLLDIQSLSWNCGPRCTVDGMHYDGAVYAASVHVMLNSLLIESHQRF